MLILLTFWDCNVQLAGYNRGLAHTVSHYSTALPPRHWTDATQPSFYKLKRCRGMYCPSPGWPTYLRSRTIGLPRSNTSSALPRTRMPSYML